jgi:hypothetical protein
MMLRIAVPLTVPCLWAAPSLLAQDTAAVPAATPVDTSYVEYHDSPISLPLGLGLRVPAYDRVNGLTLPWGPKLETSDGHFDIDGLVRYRSHIGDWDPSLEGVIRPGDSNELRFFVGRGTFTNDEWIRDKLTNTVTSFFGGSDARNYYRGDEANVRFATTVTGTSTSVTPYFGFDTERDWSTGSLAPTKSPWSVYGRTGNQRMRRPNPRVAKGTITSLFGGAGLDLVQGSLDGKFSANIERSLRTALESDCVGAPVGTCFEPAGGFTQLTADARLGFPTFGSQTFTFEGHAVFTGGGGIAPAQRFAYLGGAGTLPTVNLLAIGGEQLLFLTGQYKVPFDRIQLPFIGNPFAALRYSAGNAGVDGLPTLIQNIGVSVGVNFLTLDYTIDPSSNRSPFSRRSSFSWGVSLSP